MYVLPVYICTLYECISQFLKRVSKREKKDKKIEWVGFFLYFVVQFDFFTHLETIAGEELQKVLELVLQNYQLRYVYNSMFLERIELLNLGRNFIIN